METVMKLEPVWSRQPLKSENPSIVLGVDLDPATDQIPGKPPQLPFVI